MGVAIPYIIDARCRGTAKLQQAQNLLSESTDIGHSVIDVMGQQRETIVRATNKVGACLPACLMLTAR